MNNFIDTLRHLGATRLALMGGILAALILFFIFISLRVSTPQMKLLYADLSTQDSASVAAKLEENALKYFVSADGARITVSEDQVGRARMLLAEAGLPNGGSMGYEIFDEQSGFGTTNFVQNINQLRALEGELSRTISSLESIRSARVHLVLPERKLFSREEKAASASVFLGIRPSAQVERRQILAIQSLVASAVPSMKAADVSIIDSNGNLLAKREDSADGGLNLKAEELRLQQERHLSEKVEDQVSRVVGYGKVRATVTVLMNFDQISTNEELYDPEGSVLRSSQVTEENETEREPSNDNVSVDNNLPAIGGDLLSDSGPSLEANRVEEVSNYEISKTIRSTVRSGGDVERISVGVLVDGRTVTNEEGERVYEPRSQEELDQIASLVRSAIGFDEMRGDTVEVINMQFADIDTNEEYLDERLLLGFEKDKLVETAGMITVAIMMILVVMLVLQPMVKSLVLTQPAGGADDESLTADLLAARPSNPALAAPDGLEGDSYAGALGDHSGDDSLINIQGVEGKVKASSIKKVEEIVENYPDEAVAVIRTWMSAEEES